MKPSFALLIIAFITVGLLFTSACTTTTTKLPTVGQITLARGVSPAIDKAALQRGRTLLITECAACHRLYWPGEYNEKEWKRILPVMAKRASLDERQINDLKQYMITASQTQTNKKLHVP